MLSSHVGVAGELDVFSASGIFAYICDESYLGEKENPFYNIIIITKHCPIEHFKNI